MNRFLTLYKGYNLNYDSSFFKKTYAKARFDNHAIPGLTVETTPII